MLAWNLGYKEDCEEWYGLRQGQGIVLQLDEAVEPPFRYSGRLVFTRICQL